MQIEADYLIPERLNYEGDHRLEEFVANRMRALGGKEKLLCENNRHVISLIFLFPHTIPNNAIKPYEGLSLHIQCAWIISNSSHTTHRRILHGFRWFINCGLFSCNLSYTTLNLLL